LRVFCFILFSFSLLLGALDASPWCILFGSDGCDECQEIKELWGEISELPGRPRLLYVNIDKQENYQLLTMIERQLEVKRPGNMFPIILFGSKMLSGTDELLEHLRAAGDKLPPPPDIPALKKLEQVVRASDAAVVTYDAEPQGETAMPAAEPTGQQFPLLYFFQKGCQNCSRQLRELQQLSRLLPGLQVDCYDIGTEAGQLMLQRARELLNIPLNNENLTPMVAWQDGYIAKRLARAEELQAVLRPAAKDIFWKKAITAQERRALQRIQSNLLRQATLTVIAVAGLIDGINPCAFATSIFLIGYLLYLKRRPRQIILVGACFCIGVFASYLLFGLGFSFLIDFLGRMIWLKPLLYLLFGLAALVLAVLHLRDAWRFRASGKSSDMDLGLSQNTHRRIHDQIKKLTTVHARLLIPASLLLGVVVSSMELACTGQIYLPTLAAINSAGVNLRAFSLLLLYNFFFIIPLLIVTGLAAVGIGGKALAGWARRHVFPTKILMAGLFISLTALMFVFAWVERPSTQVEMPQAVDCLHGQV
jgi:cytochrome c biogenesis protein CcdA